MMKKNQKKGMMGITIPTINVAGLTGFGMPTTKKRTDGGIAAVMQQFGNQTAIGGFKMPEVKPVKKTTGMIRGRTRRRDGDYALTPEEIADAEQLTGDQMANLNLNDPKQAAIYQRLIFHGRSIPTSDIRISESEAECQQIIHEYITDSTNPKNVLFKFRNKSNKGWYEHKLSAYQMLQLVKLFPGIAHGSYDVKNIRASYSRSQKGVYAFYIKKEVADLLKKIGMKIPEDKGQHGDATPARDRSKNKNKDKTVPPVEKPVEQPQAPVDDASDVITLPNLEGGEVESGREIERRGKRAKAVMNRAGPKKQGNPVFGKMASVIGVPSFTMPQPAAKKPVPATSVGAGTVASARKMVTRAQTGPTFGTSIFPAIGLGQIGGPASTKKKIPRTNVNIDIAVPVIMRKRRR